MRIKTFILGSLLAVVIMICVGAAVIYFLVLPSVKPFAEDKLSEALKRPVTIGSITVNRDLLVTFKDLAVRDAASPEENITLSIDSIYLHPDIDRSVKEKAVFLKMVEFYGLDLNDPSFGHLMDDAQGFIAFTEGLIQFESRSGPMKLSGLIEMTPSRQAAIKESELSFGSSKISLSGDIGDIGDPMLDISGSFLLDITDLPLIFPAFDAAFRDLELKGHCRIDNARFRGRPRELKKASFGADLASDDLKIFNQSINEVRAHLEMANGTFAITRFFARIYGGEIRIETRCDAFNDTLPFAFAVACGGADFSRIIQNTGLKNKGIHGVFEGRLWLEGLLNDQGSYFGEMFLGVRNGNLGPLPIFNPIMANIGFIMQRLIPGYERVLLTQSAGNFVIRDRRISTNDLAAWGETASVHAKGYLDFDGNLDLAVENNFAEGIARGTSRWSESIQGVVSSVGQSISKGRLSGHIKKPKYESLSTTDFTRFFKGALGVIRDIF
ncbi:hypothetical protein ACFL42_02945 [Candidatus Omnitrophota bacterium]